jgi:hypothetical protein
MKLNILYGLGLAALALGFAGCNTFQSRARQLSGTYESLPPETQERLQRGAIAVGDNADMVYIALGNPDERRDIQTADGTRSVWIYKTYHDRYAGSQWAGYRRVFVPTRRGYAIYHEPVTYDVYRTHADERIRITFDRGVVSVVEQTSRS